ncbi:unnamed protein product [Schistocephalus solidus]|uniref:Uncharacterized protein n=1 Tax=Schistocephalus solidus TaxID=70667 RepID=A0A183T3G3_SCHSO|nr:unnamed protein product [Schistocephalus solidus]
MGGAETGNAHGSDHVLVRTRLKVHLSSVPKMSRSRRLDVAKIRQAALPRSCLTTPTDGEGSSEWPSLNALIYGAAEKVLGFTQRRPSDWISGRTLQLSAQTALARSRNDASFCQLRKMTTKSATEKHEKHWAEIATSNVGDNRKLHQITCRPSTLSNSVRDVSGSLIAENPAMVERWREHIENVPNFDTEPSNPYHVQRSLLPLLSMQCHATLLLKERSLMP